MGGMMQAVAHLTELGHKKIGFVSTDNFQTSSVSDRYKGYLAGLEEAGIRPSPLWVGLCRGDREALRAYLREVKPTAVVAVNDYIAAEVLRAAREEGLEVPRDLAIVGFDDSDVARSCRSAAHDRKTVCGRNGKGGGPQASRDLAPRQGGWAAARRDADQAGDKSVDRPPRPGAVTSEKRGRPVPSPLSLSDV